MTEEWEKNIGRVTTFDVELEEAAAESAQDRRDHARLGALVDEMSKHEDVMRVPLAVRRLVDVGVDPVVIAKVLLVGDREASLLYRLSARTPALAGHEEIAVTLIGIAIRDVEASIAATMLISGSVWLAEQFGIERSLLTSFVGSDLPRRAVRADRRGCGALDLVDNDGLGNRAWLVDAIGKSQLPSFAPLELGRPT